MSSKIVLEAINTGSRSGPNGWYRELILLYEDGTWEKLFRSRYHCNISCMGVEHLRGKTRDQVVAKLEGLINSGKLEGEFFNKD